MDVENISSFGNLDNLMLRSWKCTFATFAKVRISQHLPEKNYNNLIFQIGHAILLSDLSGVWKYAHEIPSYSEISLFLRLF
jgi:hypothetical protein